MEISQKTVNRIDLIDKLDILYTNADGLINKRQELRVLINSLQDKPDVIAITEIKPKNMLGIIQPSEFNLDGYNVFCQGLSDNQSRGLLVYVASYLEATLVDVPDAFSESLFLMLKSTHTANRLLFGNIYRRPNSTQSNDNNLYELIDYVADKFKMQKLIVGDFNFSNIQWYPQHGSGTSAKCSLLNDNELAFVSSLRENLLMQHVIHPTRQRGSDTPHTLDLVITSEDFVSEIEHISPLGMSDHCVLKFACQQHFTQFRNKDKLRLDRGDYKQLREFLNVNWDDFLKVQDNSIDDIWEKFKVIMHDGIKQSIPLTRGQGKKGNAKKNFQPFSANLKSLIHRKHRLWNRWISTRREAVYNEYKVIRNKVKSEMGKLLRQEQEKISVDCKKNPKIFWQYINKRNKSKTNVGDLKWQNSNGSEMLAQDDKEKAQALQEFFSSVYTTETDDVSERLLNRIDDNITKSIDFVLTQEDIYASLAKLKINKSPGPDQLHPRILYETRDVITYPLFLIFNKSLETGRLPQDWKLAEVTAIYKKGPKHDRSNYRPISLTSVCCKILESLIRDHMMTYLLDNKLLSKRQYGFIRNRSTSLQLLQIMDKWTEYLEYGGQVDVIYSDFEKAFDKIPHKRLISKLISYGFNTTLINWIQDFLKSRKFRVRVNSSFSLWDAVTSGIPQGSVLGPLLFIIFINDLVECCEPFCEIYLFADDAKLFRHIVSPNDNCLLQKGIDALLHWSQQWLLKLNISKCNIVSFGRYVDKSYMYNISQNNHITFLDRKQSFKDLGVIIDEKLTFRDHIHDKINKAYAMLGIIKRNFKYLTISSFVLLYKSMVRSHLDYCSSVWVPYKKGDIELLEKVQKRATKLIPTLRTMAYTERLKACKLPTLHYRHIRGDMIEMYKIVSGKYDTVLTPQVIRDYSSITRGNDLRLQKSRVKYDLRKYYFTNRAINVWNSLPNRVVLSDTVNTFKSKLDKFWQQQPIIYDFKAEIQGTGSRSWY